MVRGVPSTLDPPAGSPTLSRVRFRPHAKTSKCAVVVQRQIAAGATGITVSTLKEAERFFAAGIDDILYAVAIVVGAGVA